MDGHSKRKVLEIFNINYKNVFSRFLFLNRPPKWSRDISRDLLTQCLYFKMLRADVRKYRPEVYKSEKSKIPKKIHKVALGKLLT